MPSPLSKSDFQQLLRSLNEEVKADGVTGHLNMAGGAVMSIAFDARASTRDVDAVFEPSVKILEAALRVARKEGVSENWLNDDVKGYLGDRGSFDPLLELSNLEVRAAPAKYMLAMKCLAMRIGEGYRDEEDIRYLLRNLGIRRFEDAREILEQYYPWGGYPEAAIIALQELLPGE